MRFSNVIKELAETKGTLACAVVDYESGMMLDGESPSGMDLDILSVGNTEIVRSEVKAIDRLYNSGKGNKGQEDKIQDILITLGKQYYLLRPMITAPGLFLFLVLDRNLGNLALARRIMKNADRHYQDS